jgi:membrane associated rhomboid family serine protease
MGPDDTTGQFERLGGALRELWTGKVPLVSLALAIVWIVCQGVVEIGYSGRLERARAELGHSVEYFVEHPMLRIEPRMIPVLRNVMPGFEGNEVFSFLSKGQATDEGPSPQTVLDEKVWNAFGMLDSHPFRRLGVVPALAKPHTYLTFSLIHAGWLHLLASLALLFAVGPLLERTFGRAPFMGMILTIAVGSAALYAYVSPGVDRPLIGGTVIAIGLVSAVVVRFKAQNVDFAEWLSPWNDAEIRVPAWWAAIPALALVGAISLLTEVDLPASVGIAPGYVSYATASLLGVGFALTFAKYGVEKRFGDAPKPLPKPQPRTPQRLDMRRVEKAREAGDLDKAYPLLHAEAVHSAGNRDIVLAYWDLAVETRRASEAVPLVFRLLGEELRRGAVEIAAAHWCRVVDVVDDARLEAKTLAVLLPWIKKLAGADKVILALEHVMHTGAEAKDPLPGPVIADIALMAAEIAPDIAETAAQLALGRSGISEERRTELKGLLASTAPQEDEPPSFQTPGGEVPENAFYAEQDRSEFDDGVGDLGGLLPDELGNMPEGPPPSARFPSAKVALAVPRALDPEALALNLDGRGEVRLAYSRICGVTIAGVGGLAAKPIVIVDLLLSGPDPDDLPLEVVRLRGDQFDPRSLVAGETAPLPALRAFVGELLKRSGGAAIPSREILDPNARVQMFETVEEYQRDVLRVRG